MRVAHLILTYTNPVQTERMIRNMQHADSDFYIHVDKKLDINTHSNLKKLNNIFFLTNRTDVKWAGFSTVLATFKCIREIVDTGIKYDFINFLSGQDYPVTPATQLASFLGQNIGKEFMSYRDIKNEWKEGLIRMENYFLCDHSFKGRNILEKTLTFLLPKRKLPHSLHPYGKSMFWMLSPEAAIYVANKVENDKQLMNFFSLCWGSDEFVFQTILFNSDYKHKVVNNNYRYIDWSLGGASPKLLDETDFEAIKNSDAFFTRKVDAYKSAKLLDLIDAKLLQLI